VAVGESTSLNILGMHFDDYPEFRPNLTPRQIFEQGAFGGTYWRKIYSKVTEQNYEDQWKEFPCLIEMVKNNPEKITLLSSEKFSAKNNKYGKKSGTSLIEWESNGWIKSQDPYGWVQWYCRFFYGRRTADDRRQIDRWLNFTGPNGRFKKNLINKIRESGLEYDDPKVSPVIRQGLHQWGYCLTQEDMK
jgi:hypothetical protein